MKTTAAQSKINDLRKINKDLMIRRIEVAKAVEWMNKSDLFVLLTAAIVVNERRIKELQSS